jgi:hypothetical protein
LRQALLLQAQKSNGYFHEKPPWDLTLSVAFWLTMTFGNAPHFSNPDLTEFYHVRNSPCQSKTRTASGATRTARQNGAKGQK